MLLKVVLLLLVLAFVARRLLPRRPMTWAAPLVLVGVVLAVRTVGYLQGGE